MNINFLKKFFINSSFIVLLLTFSFWVFADDNSSDSTTVTPLSNTYKTIPTSYIADTSPDIRWLNSNSQNPSGVEFNFLTKPNSICEHGYTPYITFEVSNANYGHTECGIGYFHYELDNSDNLGHPPILQEGNAYRVYYVRNIMMPDCSGTFHDDDLWDSNDLFASYTLYCMVTTSSNG